MYSSSSSATHHIFFPPRLQVVAFEQDANCLPAHLRDQLSLDRLFGHQPHGPASPSFRRITTDHGDDSLPFRSVQQGSSPGPLPLIQGSFQAVLPVPPTDVPDRLGG